MRRGLIVAAVLCAGCGREKTSPPKDRAAGSNPAPPPSLLAYVSNEVSQDLSVIATDRDSVIATIPLDNKLPGVKGIKGPLSCLSQARYGIAWGVIGAAMGCYDWALQYAQQRIQFGKPIGAFQLVQQKLVWMINEITKAQLLCLQLGRLKDAGRARPQQISLAKMNNVQMALDTARLARDILGAAGIVDEHPIMRHMMNLETVNTYEGTHDIHVLIVGRDITGLDAFGI